MLETQAQIVLLVRAFEEADRRGSVLSSYARATATRRTLRVTGLANWSRDAALADDSRYTETAIRRARVLFESLERKIPGLRGMIRLAELGASTGPAVLAAAFAIGLGMSALGSVGLYAIVAWNLGLYLVLLAPALVRPARRLRQVVPWLTERFLRGALWRRLHGWQVGKGGPEEWRGIAARALMRFAGSWHRSAGALLAARVRRTLHLGAAALACGAIAGRTDWAEALLLYVVAPRIALALVECWRCRVHADIDIDLHDAYFRRAFTEWRGATRHIEVVPYGYEPKDETRAALTAVLRDYFGVRAELRVARALAHGDDASTVSGIPRSSREAWAPAMTPYHEPDDPERETCHVVLFDMAQPPEPAVHGTFLRQLMRRLEAGRGRLLVVVDPSTSREHAPVPGRPGERFGDWERLAREAGAMVVELDLQRPLDDEASDTLDAAIWQPETARA